MVWRLSSYVNGHLAFLTSFGSIHTHTPPHHLCTCSWEENIVCLAMHCVLGSVFCARCSYSLIACVQVYADMTVTYIYGGYIILWDMRTYVKVYILCIHEHALMHVIYIRTCVGIATYVHMVDFCIIRHLNNLTLSTF